MVLVLAKEAESSVIASVIDSDYSPCLSVFVLHAVLRLLNKASPDERKTIFTAKRVYCHYALSREKRKLK